MRNPSIAIIAFAAMLIGIFSLYPIGNTIEPNPIKPPHGDNFNMNCNICHSTKGWKIDKKIYSFNHDTTKMPLVGQHAQVDCKLCHPTLIFSEAETECAQCHTDMHESTVGKECSRCHSPHSWLVNNITQIHQQSRFPLVGVHARVDCYQCHLSESLHRFDIIGTECYSCHSNNYEATTQPNHVNSGFSTNCDDCHNVFSNAWTGAGYNHAFFPLTQGHALSSCNQCHTLGIQTKLSPECINCHQTDYSATTNPVHSSLNFSTTCTQCHTTAPGWKPAKYAQHDAFSFPIYSGKHNGKWSSCVDCHTNQSNYKEYTCIDCHAHNRTDMDDKHSGESGYIYNSAACLDCHPNGNTN